VALGLYFAALSPCREYDAGPLALHWPDRTGRVRPVLALLWGDGIAGQIANVLFLLGLASAFWRPGGRDFGDERPPRAAFASWLARGIVAQLALTVLLAAQVVIVGYYFLARVFLHLMICRALLVAVGGWTLTRWLEERANPLARTALQALASGLAVFALAMAFVSVEQSAQRVRAVVPAPTEQDCGPVAGTLVLDWPTGSRDWALGPNSILRLSERRRRCGPSASSEVRHVLVGDPGSGDYRFSADRAPGAIALEQCGREVVLGPDGKSF